MPGTTSLRWPGTNGSAGPSRSKSRKRGTGTSSGCGRSSSKESAVPAAGPAVLTGIDLAVYAQARETAGEEGADIAGGAATVRQALIAGVIDELALDIAPVLLGSGERIVEGVDSFGLEPVEVLHSSLATHIRYRRAG